MFLFAMAAIAASGCGGSGKTGSGGSGTSGGGVTGSKVPTLSGIAPSTVQVGAPSTPILAFGSNFKDGATIQWNGTALASTCVGADVSTSVPCANATALSATVPASNFAADGIAKVSASNPSPGGGTSTSLTFTIAPKTAGRTWIRGVPGITAPNDVVWDGPRQKLYVSVASNDPVAPNSILAIDPIAGTGAMPVAAGNNPNLLTISSDDSYLWVGMDGSNTVQRFLLSGLTKDISFPLPSDWARNPQQAVALEAAPVNPHVIALIAGHWGGSPAGDGVYVYDDSTPRPLFVPGMIGSSPGPTIDWMQWGADDSVIYGDQYTTIDAGGIATMNVTPSGVSLTNYNGGGLNPTITQYSKNNGLLYSYGGAYDPVKLTQVGQFDLPTTGAEACTADSTIHRYYCVTTFYVGSTDVTGFELRVFDLTSYALVDRVSFGFSTQGGPGSSVTGRPLKLVRWGNAGLALTTYAAAAYGSGGVFLIDGAAVNPNASADVSSGASSSSYAWLSSLSPQSATTTSGAVKMTIQGSGFSPGSTACRNCNFLQLQFLPTEFVSPTQLNVTFPVSDLPTTEPFEISVFDPSANLFSTNALTFTLLPASGSTQVIPLNLCGLSMAWDAGTQLLYVGTAAYDGAYPNAVVAVDGNGTIAKSQTVEPNPIFLSDAANGEFLYVAYSGSTNLTQLALPGLNTTASGVLNNPQTGPWIAGDMKAAPQNPHTAAVTLIKPGWSPESLGGVVIFDDGVARPNFAPGWTGGQKVPAFLDTLAWGSTDQELASAPSAWDSGVIGPLYELRATPSGVSYAGQGTAIFNQNGGDIHSDFGTGLIYSDDGTVANPSNGVIVGDFRSSGLVAPDSSLNRVFILGQTAAQANSTNFTIQSFNETTFAPVASITLNNLSGSPLELIRWGTSGLAVLTGGGIPGFLESGMGMLYLVNDAKFVSNVQPAVSTQTIPELVQWRWKRESKRELLTTSKQASQTRSSCCQRNHIPEN